MEAQLKHYEDKLSYEIDSWDLHEAVKNGDPVVIVDTRSREAYDSGHIEGAVSMPHKEMAPETTRTLARDRLYVTYCDGIGCNASTKGARKMLQLGFRVKELMGGIDWWIRDGHPTEGTAASARADVDCGCG